MTTPIWAKGDVDLDAAVQKFCAADDVILDRALFLHDIKGTLAHAHALVHVMLLTPAELDTLKGHLADLERAFRAGEFVLDDRFEDCHSAIEAYLVEKAGELGKKVHTGRSRNDQVLTAQRLYVRAQLDRLIAATKECASRLLARARETQALPMPGHTHLQPAMPTSLGAFLAGHAEGFIDDALAARSARDVVDACPLGTASGFGTILRLDRDSEAKELGFTRLALNPLAAQNGRGKLELFALQALHLAVLDVRRLAWDLSFFVSAEASYAKLPTRYTTGSSLMPNKRNPDVVELLRALPPVVEGAMHEIGSLLSLPSGYHRDLQATKAPLIRAFERALSGIELVPNLVDAIEWDEERMENAITGDMHATDRALELAVEGVPFRDAYVQAAKEIPTLADRDPEESLQRRVSLGGAGNLALERLEERLKTL